MIKRIKEVKGLSSPLSFIIIIVLVVVSVTAIVVGGGDGFSRKYAGVDLHEFNARMLLAQTGVLGKILQFEKRNGQYELNLLPIELDGSLLAPGEKYVSSVIPPREGDTPFSYRPEEGIRVVQGYPLLKSYVDKHNLKSFDFGEGSSSGNTDATSVNTLVNTLPNIPGMEVCNVGSGAGLFNVFYEDIAYETGVGFNDPEKGERRQEAVCNVLGEFEEMLLLDEYGLRPGIVIQASTEKVPEHALSVVSPQYVGGSGFVSTLLADYLRTGVRRSTTTFTDTVSVLGINSGFIRFNFDDDIAWTVDSDSEDASGYDLETVTRQNMLRLLGFGSFLGHEQENILSSSWKRWTEWDRLLIDSSDNRFINNFNFSSFDYSGNDNLGDSEEYDSKLVSEGTSLLGYYIPDRSAISAAQNFKKYPVYTSEKFQKGQSLSGILGEGAASTPIMSENSSWSVTPNEKEILCFLGLAVDGVAGCSKPRPVAQDVYIERQNNLPVCVNIGQGLYSAVSDANWVLAGSIVEMTGTLNVGNQEKFRMYSAPCPDATFVSKEAQQAFAATHGTTNVSQVKSFSWTPTVTMPDMPGGPDAEGPRAHLQFAFSLKDSSTGRATDQRIVSIHKCEVSIHDNQLCNGDFQFGNARSPVDFKIAPLQSFEVGRTPIVSCQSAAMPGWCAQGVQDGFSSEFGYTWHPYLIENPEAYDFDSEWNVGPRKYAGGSSGALVQRLRVPLQKNTTYYVSGYVYVTENGLRPTFWYGSQNTILPQPDGTYHVDYPEVLAGNGQVINEYVLNEPLTKGEWHEFSWEFNTGNNDVTHIAFGGSNNNGFILYDELSVYMGSDCDECLSDINGDCVTNMDDAIAFMEQFSGSCPNETVGCKGDINFDGVVNNDDLLAFIDRYEGTSCLIEPENPYAGLDQENQVCLAKLNEHLSIEEFSVVPVQNGDSIPSDSQYYAILGADPESLPWGEIPIRENIILDDCGFYVNPNESDLSKSVWWLLVPPYDPDEDGGGGKEETPSCELDPEICSCIVVASEFAQDQGYISSGEVLNIIVFDQDTLPGGDGAFLIVGASSNDITWMSGHETIGSVVMEDCGFYVNFEETSGNRHVFWLLTPPYEFPEQGDAESGEKNPYEGFSQNVQSCIALFNDNGRENGLFNRMELDRVVSVVYGAHESETFLENQAYIISGVEPGDITWDDLPGNLDSNGTIFERTAPDDDCGFYKDVDGPIWYLLIPPHEESEAEESTYRTCIDIIRNDYHGAMIGSLNNQSCVDEFQSTLGITVVSYGDSIPRGDGTFIVLVDETQALDSGLTYTEGYYRYDKLVSSGGSRTVIHFITEESDGRGELNPRRETSSSVEEELLDDSLGDEETEEEGEELGFLRTILASLGLGNGSLFSRTSSNILNENTGSEMQNPAGSDGRYVFLDGNGLVEGIDVKVIFKEKKEIVPNSDGFKANYLVEIRNTTLRTISGLNIIGILPSLLIYNGHVSTEPNIGYNQTSNTLFIPEIRPNSSSVLQRDQAVRVYFNANLNSNTCSQLFNSDSKRTYDTLIELDLCRDYDLLQRRASESDFVQDLLQLYR